MSRPAPLGPLDENALCGGEEKLLLRLRQAVQHRLEAGEVVPGQQVHLASAQISSSIWMPNAAAMLSIVSKVGFPLPHSMSLSFRRLIPAFAAKLSCETPICCLRNLTLRPSSCTVIGNQLLPLKL